MPTLMAPAPAAPSGKAAKPAKAKHKKPAEGHAAEN
jgi:hypothetical protein